MVRSAYPNFRCYVLRITVRDSLADTSGCDISAVIHSAKSDRPFQLNDSRVSATAPAAGVSLRYYRQPPLAGANLLILYTPAIVNVV